MAAYLTNRKQNWWALIPGGVMLFLALVTLLVDTTVERRMDRRVVPVHDRPPILVVYLPTDEGWWALIPAGVMLSFR
ncbi:MAG: hypothetical protein MZU84_07065 [Sphingobacterium sp.]|nr:hypothetical protein [Sphingobacterium sp.]